MKKVSLIVLLSMATIGQTLLSMNQKKSETTAKKKKSTKEEFNALIQLIQKGDQNLEAIKKMVTHNPKLLKHIDNQKSDALGWAVYVHNKPLQTNQTITTVSTKKIINYFLTAIDPQEKPLMVDTHDNTLLHYAASHCDLETLQNICDFCSQALVCPNINSPNKDTYTPLCIASTQDKPDHQQRQNILNLYMQTIPQPAPTPAISLEKILCSLEKQYYTVNSGARDLKQIKLYDQELYERITHTIPAQVADQMKKADQDLDGFQCATDIATLILAKTGDHRPLRIINPVTYKALYGASAPNDNQPAAKRQKLKK